MHPILFELPLPGGASLAFPAYGTFMVIGMLLANLAAVPRAGAIGLRPGQVFDFGLLLVAGGVFVSHLLHVAVHFESYARQGLVDGTLAALMPWRGGLVYYGGLAGGVLVAVFYARRKGIRPLDLLDFVAPIGALGLASTRVGCFLNGCCWGAPTHATWGVTFPPGSPAQESQRALGLVAAGAPTLPVHPVQLYETAAALVLFAVLYSAYPRRRFPGQMTAWFLILYSTWRLAIETLRADASGWRPGMAWWQLNVYQWLSLAILGGAVAGLSWLRRRDQSVRRAST